jgi:hypothetical protein
LAFLGAIHGARLADEAHCRFDNEGHMWWAAVPVPWEQAAGYVWTAGGVPFARLDGQWFPIAPGGAEPMPVAATFDPHAWPAIDPGSMLARVTARLQLPVPTDTVDVMLPGQLARWVLRRALDFGLETSVTSAERRPLHGEGPAGTVMVVRLRNPRGNLPGTFLFAASRLPGVVVGRPVPGEHGQLIVEFRHRFPLADVLLASLVAAGETWVIGSPDVAPCRLQLSGDATDGAGFVVPPEPPAIDLPPISPVTAIPKQPLRLTARPDYSGRVDAVLVDDGQLGWLRDYLAARPAGEMAFLLLGPGRHLLTAPGGLAAAVPFGVPLVRVEPGGLYVESGFGFSPPLPEGARRAAFGLDVTSAVAVTQEGAYRFAIDKMIPAWTLWLGEAPVVRSGLSREAEDILAVVGHEIRKAEAENAAPQPNQGRGPIAGNRQQLLIDAQRAELAGNLVRAAELLEAAGELARAGRLYERAARR